MVKETLIIFLISIALAFFYKLDVGEKIMDYEILTFLISLEFFLLKQGMDMLMGDEK